MVSEEKPLDTESASDAERGRERERDQERKREACPGSTSLRKDLSVEGRVVKTMGYACIHQFLLRRRDRDDVTPRVPRLFIDDSLSGRSTSFTRARVLLLSASLLLTATHPWVTSSPSHLSASCFPRSSIYLSLSLSSSLFLLQAHRDRLMEVGEAEASRAGRSKLDTVFLGVIGR